MVKVHYFFDPMCGWCYGATPLIEALSDAKDFDVIYHPGGMVPKKAVDHSFRQHILRNDRQIEAQTGMKFGDDYVARLNNNREFVLDSYLPTRAILVGEKMGIAPFVTLKRIQEAHYQQGGHVDQLDTLKQIALSQNLDQSTWLKEMQKGEQMVVNTLQNSHKLISQFSVNGYPSLIAEVDNSWLKLPLSNYYSKESEWKNYLINLSAQ